jgi:antitoxin component of MazEF toxin-antitoxin module
MFKAKLRKIGNSMGVIIPSNVITSYKEGDEITLNVITSGQENKDNVITSKPTRADIIRPKYTLI